MSDETPVADFLRFCHEQVTVDGEPLDLEDHQRKFLTRFFEQQRSALVPADPSAARRAARLRSIAAGAAAYRYATTLIEHEVETERARESARLLGVDPELLADATLDELAKLSDQVIYGASYETPDGRRIDPRYVSPTQRPPAPMAMTVTMAEQDHHADLRRRSYELALQRGHVRR